MRRWPAGGLSQALTNIWTTSKRRRQAVNDGRTSLSLQSLRLVGAVAPAVGVLIHRYAMAQENRDRRVDLFQRHPWIIQRNFRSFAGNLPRPPSNIGNAT